MTADVLSVRAGAGQGANLKKASPAILVKARVGHERIAAMFEQFRETMHASTKAGLERQDFASVGLSLHGFCRTCLELGMGWFKLDSDRDKARRTFLCAAEIIPIVDEVERRIGVPDEIMARPRWKTGRCFGSETLLMPILCLALAGDRDRTLRVAEFHRNPAMRHDDEKNALNVFAQHLSAAVRDEPDAARMSDYDIDRSAKLYIENYKFPLSQLIQGDPSVVRAALPEWDAGFRARARMREPDAVYGASPLGQATAFDALATSIVRVANWRGANIASTSESAPVAFCVD